MQSHCWEDQNTGVGSLSLLQGIFPAQESKPGLLHCRQVLYQEVVVTQICECIICHWIVLFKMANFFLKKKTKKESKSMAKGKCKI